MLMNKMERKIHSVLTKAEKPLNRNEIAKRTGDYQSNRRTFNRTLSSMVRDQVIYEKKGRYGIARSQKLAEAEIVKVADTFGFATPEDGGDDIFVPGRFLMGSMPGDKVVLRLSKDRSGELGEGEVIRITEENNKPFAGTITRCPNGGYQVQPDSYVSFPMYIKGNLPSRAKVGDKVLAQLKNRGRRHSYHQVEIVSHFGSADKASVCAEAILAENEIEREFPKEVEEQAQAIGSGVGIHPKELGVRVDLRDQNIFTIDGADTKDIDDAISLNKTKSGWELGVHIADVSYYVTRKSPLDEEAYRRGCSVYFADQVVPMLPPELSNGICSLNPGEDRLAFSAIIQLSPKGEIESYKFQKTVINSKIKGVYSEINEILEGTASKEVLDKYDDQIETIKNMEELSKLLAGNRKKRNSVDLESTESKILIDSNGKIVDIVERHQGISEGIIEEFMLVANESAARFSHDKEIPFIYRIHESPAEERLEALYLLLDNLGVSYKRPKEGENPSATLDQILAQVKDTPLQDIVNYSVLRSMAKAKYSPENKGHFGLALSDYAHFTSPIRRYPDLVIHRIMSSLLTGMRRDNIEKFFRSWVGPCSQHSTAREIASMTAERSAEDSYKAEYMSQYVGDDFEGVITTATGFGVFVQLANTVEGLVHISEFPNGDWQYDDVITYTNHSTGDQIKIGDKVKVKVVGADVATGKIDFNFVI